MGEPSSSYMIQNDEKMKQTIAEEFLLPPGFRFHPTDQELINIYLCRKVAGAALPNLSLSVFTYKNPYGEEKPWEMLRGGPTGDELYLFTTIKKKFASGDSNKMDRITAGGDTWKTQRSVDICNPNNKSVVIGFKRMLNFFQGTGGGATKDQHNWIMHEYTLNCTHPAQDQETWALCRIKRGRKRSDTTVVENSQEMDHTNRSLIPIYDEKQLLLKQFGALPHADQQELPPGFRFCPTCDELIHFYLRRKVSGQALPYLSLNVFANKNPYGNEKPWELLRDSPTDDELYLFAGMKKKSATGTGDRMERITAGGGTWKIQCTVQICHPNNKSFVLGKRRMLSYSDKMEDGADPNNWVMHEYTLNSNGAAPDHETWALCRIKRGRKRPNTTISENAQDMKRTNRRLTSVYDETQLPLIPLAYTSASNDGLHSFNNPLQPQPYTDIVPSYIEHGQAQSTQQTLNIQVINQGSYYHNGGEVLLQQDADPQPTASTGGSCSMDESHNAAPSNLHHSSVEVLEQESQCEPLDTGQDADDLFGIHELLGTHDTGKLCSPIDPGRSAMMAQNTKNYYSNLLHQSDEVAEECWGYLINPEESYMGV